MDETRALMPGVELDPEPPPDTLCQESLMVLLDGKRIGCVRRSVYSDEWKAVIDLDIDDLVNPRFQFVSGEGKTPFEAIEKSLLASDLELKTARSTLQTLSYLVLGKTREEYQSWAAKRKPNQLQFESALHMQG